MTKFARAVSQLRVHMIHSNLILSADNFILVIIPSDDVCAQSYQHFPASSTTFSRHVSLFLLTQAILSYAIIISTHNWASIRSEDITKFNASNIHYLYSFNNRVTISDKDKCENPIFLAVDVLINRSFFDTAQLCPSFNLFRNLSCYLICT